jgi:hypothetical protein
MSAVILNAEERHRVGLDDTPPAGDDIPRRDRAVAQLRVPPHSEEAEARCWAACCSSTPAGTASATCSPDADFYRYEHRLIFEAIGGLVNANRPADVVTVFDQPARPPARQKRSAASRT